MKFRTAVPPPNKTDMKALKDPNTRPIFPFTIAQTESNRDINVPTFCFIKSTIPLILNISKKI